MTHPRFCLPSSSVSSSVFLGALIANASLPPPPPARCFSSPRCGFMTIFFEGSSHDIDADNKRR